MEHSFITQWQRAERALKQRNVSLKRHASDQEIVLWDKELSECAVLLDEARQRYFKMLLPQFDQVMQLLLPRFQVKLLYYRTR